MQRGVVLEGGEAQELTTRLIAVEEVRDDVLGGYSMLGECGTVESSLIFIFTIFYQIFTRILCLVYNS